MFHITQRAFELVEAYVAVYYLFLESPYICVSFVLQCLGS